MRALTTQQAEILAWIGDGCQGRDWPDHENRATAEMPQAQGLVKIMNNGSGWTATMTEAGRAGLAASLSAQRINDQGGDRGDLLVQLVNWPEDRAPQRPAVPVPGTLRLGSQQIHAQRMERVRSARLTPPPAGMPSVGATGWRRGPRR